MLSSVGTIHTRNLPPAPNSFSMAWRTSGTTTRAVERRHIERVLRGRLVADFVSSTSNTRRVSPLASRLALFHKRMTSLAWPTNAGADATRSVDEIVGVNGLWFLARLAEHRDGSHVGRGLFDGVLQLLRATLHRVRFVPRFVKSAAVRRT